VKASYRDEQNFDLIAHYKLNPLSNTVALGNSVLVDQRIHGVSKLALKLDRFTRITKAVLKPNCKSEVLPVQSRTLHAPSAQYYDPTLQDHTSADECPVFHTRLTTNGTIPKSKPQQRLRGVFQCKTLI
jgi:hypothetical protein